MFYRIFIAHPKTVDESFFEHFLFALRFSGALFAAAFAALVHAFIPCLFEKTASTIIAKLYERTHNRGSQRQNTANTEISVKFAEN